MRSEFFHPLNGRLCSFCNGFLRRFSTNTQRNFYDVLGVDRKAEQSEIKKAFYTLSKKYHPDVVGSSNTKAAEKFLEVKDAYDVLKDENQRRMYDQQLEGGGYGGGGPRPASSAQDAYYRQQYGSDRDYYQHVRRPPPPNNGAQYSQEDFHRIWRAMQGNREFKRATEDFNEYLRRSREKAFNDFAARRENRYRRHTEEELNKNPFNPSFKFQGRKEFSIIQKVLTAYFTIFLISALYQYFRKKDVVVYDDVTHPNKSARDKINEMINRPPRSY